MEESTYPNNNIDKLMGKKIFFAHQSVGENILDGLTSLSEANQVSTVNIENENNFKDSEGLIIYHCYAGRNLFPVEKIDDFSKRIHDTNEFDIAFLKLCYVDIEGDSEPEAVFQAYIDSYEELERIYPQIQFVYFTMPLTTLNLSWKDPIKRLLGKYTTGLEGNYKRKVFNDLLRSSKCDTGMLFDIAYFESLDSNGTSMTARLDDHTVEILNPQYSDDGGHLNDSGKRIIAGELTSFLVDICSE